MVYSAWMEIQLLQIKLLIQVNFNHIYEIAHKYNAFTLVDESHAAGFIGNTGRGTPEYFNLMNEIDVINGTMGKAFGGGSGGFILYL